MSPFISVIIPAYRSAKTIGRAVDSVLAQTRPPDEVLIIDDGSPDDLARAVEPYRRQVTIIRQPNTGASAARNRGIDAAQGDLIAFLDADDFWEPMKLECQLDVLRRHPQVAIVASQYCCQTPGHQPQLPSFDNHGFLDCVLIASTDLVLEIARRLWTSTVMIRRTAMEQNRFDCQLKVAEDLDLWIRLLAEHPAYILSQPLATMVFEPASLSRSDPDEGYSPMVTVAHRYAKQVSQRSLRCFESLVYRGWASAHLSRGCPRAALRPAWRRLCRQPLSPEAWWILGKCAALACVGGRRSSSPSDPRVLRQSRVPEQSLS
ncbi:MAG: glycosyltransferase family 2 protein [Bacillota bacterium]